MTVHTSVNSMKISNTQAVNNNITTEPNSKENKPVSKTVLGVSLVGLTALASVGIYLATRGKGKVKSQTLVDEAKNPTNNTQLEEFQKQAKELKDKIRHNYAQRVNEECPRISYHRNNLAAKEVVVSKFSSNLKNKLRVLQNDPEYVELTKLKQRYKREFIRNDDPLSGEKLKIINELIYTKMNDGYKTRYFRNFGLSCEEAIDIMKDPSIKSIKEYHQAIYKNIDRTKVEIQDLEKMPKACAQDYIRLEDIVIGGQDARSAYIQTQQAKKYLKDAHNTKINIAQEFRQSDDVKALKELNRQIVELQKQNTK